MVKATSKKAAAKKAAAKKTRSTLSPQEIVRAATSFYASLFLGAGKFDKRECSTIEEAIDALGRLKADHPKASRKPMIYAMIDGRSEFLDHTALTAPTAPETSDQKPEAPKVAESKKRGVAARMAKVAEALSKPRPEKKARAATAPTGKRAESMAAALTGNLPTPPDFSAATHTRFRPKLAQVVALADAGDVAGLRAFAINPISSSPKAIARYRDLCVTALEAKAAA